MLGVFQKNGSSFSRPTFKSYSLNTVQLYNIIHFMIEAGINRAGVSRAERKKEIYEGIGADIELILKYWEAALGLPLISPRDPIDQDASDARILAAPVKKFLDSLEDKGSRIRQVVGSGLQRKVEKSSVYEEYFDFASQVPPSLAKYRVPIVLLNSVIDVTQRRMEIRGMIASKGEDWLDPNLYTEDVEDAERGLLSRVVEIMPGRFSINFLVQDSAFFEYCRKNGMEEETWGFHIPGGTINFIRDNPYLKSGKFLSLDEKDELIEEIAQHEDFHALADFLPFPPGGSLQEQFERDLSIKDALLYGGSLGDISPVESYYPFVRRNFTLSLREGMDPDHEELIAELVSTTSDHFPRRTFARNMSAKKKLLESIGCGNNSPVGEIMDKYKEFVDPDSYRKMLDEIFSVVESKIPEKSMLALAALAYFPPSQMRHLRRLVKYWAENPS